jgi:type I restriction enzyme S subunit
MSFPRYPAYKYSGVEWLGEVPDHWEVRKLKNFAAFTGGGTPSRENLSFWNGSIPWVSPKDMKAEKILETEEGITQEGLNASASSLVAPGHVLLVVRSGIIKHTLPVAINAIELALNQDMKAILLDEGKCTSTFLFRWIQGLNDQLILAWAKQGATVESIEQEYLTNSLIPLPPLHEQSAIAAFLDRETAKIDSLIAKQQRLIELLQEKRQAVISHAVTKGLNPVAPMKNSGVEWLGQIPKHWEVKRMKRVARMESGHTPDRKIEAYWQDCDIPWVSLNDTGYLKDNDYISETAYSINVLGIKNSSARLLPERVVIFSRDATIGRCAITTRPMAVSQHFIAWVCGLEIMPEYLLLRLRTMTSELDRLTAGATLKTIGMPDVKTLVTPLPPLSEQAAIVKRVSDVSKGLDDLLADTSEAVNLLQERRSALISAAVTGQIDVHGLVPVEAAT